MTPPCQITMLVAWRHRLFRHLWLSLFIGVVVTGICRDSYIARFLHSLTVIALGPGFDFIARRDPNSYSLLLAILQHSCGRGYLYGLGFCRFGGD